MICHIHTIYEYIKWGEALGRLPPFIFLKWAANYERKSVFFLNVQPFGAVD